MLIDEDGDYYRNVLSYQELRRRGYDLDITLQVGPDAFKLPNGSLDDFTNHSCDPNTGIRLNDRGMIVVALRDIAAHEELTYDYSTYLNNPYERLRCLCGAAELPRRDRQLQHLAGRTQAALPGARHCRQFRRWAGRDHGRRRLGDRGACGPRERVDHPAGNRPGAPQVVRPRGRAPDVPAALHGSWRSRWRPPR